MGRLEGRGTVSVQFIRDSTCVPSPDLTLTLTLNLNRDRDPRSVTHFTQRQNGWAATAEGSVEISHGDTKQGGWELYVR